MSFIINWKTHFKCMFLAMLISIIFYKQFDSIIGSFLEYPIFTGSIYRVIIIFYSCVLLIMVPLSMLHEFIHGMMFKMLGGKVVYGFKIIYAYTQEISGIAIRRSMFLIILLMPLSMISVICLIIPSRISGMIFLLNLLGSSGDILIGFTLSKYDSSSFVIDRKYGYDIINNPTV